MRLPRMTTRRWMAVVLVASLLLGVLVMSRRAAHFMRLAAFHKQAAIKIPRWVIRVNARGDRLSHAASPEQRLLDYHRKLAHKYENAAQHPWLPVEPDPAEPE
jgi:hypothetical protein